ncbi:MAG: PEP-CTERM sorting domain-containing protein [Planctomycetes bacterium]|nr:PEP-CTERM sorting domain-containing protein [Planctomycetota bacterium]
MKRLLSLALFTALAAGIVSAQATGIGGGTGIRPSDIGRNSPPVTNPEPITLIALAGGAAVAGGLLRRKSKQAK